MCVLSEDCVLFVALLSGVFNFRIYGPRYTKTAVGVMINGGSSTNRRHQKQKYPGAKYHIVCNQACTFDKLTYVLPEFATTHSSI